MGNGGLKKRAARSARGKTTGPSTAILAAAAAALAVLSGCGGGNSRPAAAAQSATTATFDGGELTPPKREPPLELRNYDGERVDIAAYKGKAVLVTFLYTRCPDTCPLIAANLRVAQQELGAKAARVQIIAVSVDPRGDTPRTVAAFLKRHGMTGRMKYLVGTASELRGAWKAWLVGSERDAHSPELVAHTAAVYGIDAGGMMRTAYIGGTWKPREIAHDVPLLASK